MRRRKAIAALALGISLPGCLGSSHHGGVVAALPDDLDGLEFERLEGDEVEVSPTDAPVLDVNWTDRRLTTEGSLYVGSGKCMQAVLDSVEQSAGTLELVVAPGKSPQHPDNSLFNFSCTEEISPDAYRITSPLPDSVDRVEVRERDARGDTYLASAEAPTE